MTTTYIGIDPGLSGAIAQIVWPLSVEATWVDDIPVAVVKASKRDYLITQILALLAGPGLKIAIVERQIAMPRRRPRPSLQGGGRVSSKGC